MNSNNGWGTAAQAHAAPPLAAKWQGLCTTVDPDRGTPGRLRGCMAAFNPTLQPPPFNLRLSTSAFQSPPFNLHGLALCHGPMPGGCAHGTRLLGGAWVRHSLTKVLATAAFF